MWNLCVIVQVFDSRSFALGGAQSHRFVPVKVADSHQTRYHQQQQQIQPQKQARAPLPIAPNFSQGIILTWSFKEELMYSSMAHWSLGSHDAAQNMLHLSSLQKGKFLKND